MIIRVVAAGVTLENVEDLKSFKMVATRDAAFALGDAGRSDGEVVAFAPSKGWYSESQHGEPAAIRAHYRVGGSVSVGLAGSTVLYYGMYSVI